MRFAFFTRNQGNRDNISNDKTRCATMNAEEDGGWREGDPPRPSLLLLFILKILNLLGI